MASVVCFPCALRVGLQIGLQLSKGLLCVRQIPGLKGTGQSLKIGVCLAVAAKRLRRRQLRIAGCSGQRLLESGQCALGGGKVVGLERTAKGSELLQRLRHGVLVGSRVKVCRRS